MRRYGGFGAFQVHCHFGLHSRCYVLRCLVIKMLYYKCFISLGRLVPLFLVTYSVSLFTQSFVLGHPDSRKLHIFFFWVLIHIPCMYVYPILAVTIIMSLGGLVNSTLRIKISCLSRNYILLSCPPDFCFTLDPK